MCGFAGFLLNESRQNADEMRSIISAMSNRLVHRGPDDSGLWVDADVGIGLGHRRLAIVDLSFAGHQPMQSACGRYVLAFNGEIYNYKALREELREMSCSIEWRGQSDTEVMLAAIVRWGLLGALRRMNGMFAFALWDRRDRTLHLGRDRLGEKPLYYGRQGDAFLFASELKGLRAHPAFCAEIDRNALSLYMQFGYFPAPHTVYRDIYKIPPGTTLSLKKGQEVGEPGAYWSVSDVAKYAETSQFAGNENDAVTELECLLGASIKDQRLADVPIGAFLSGGIDSSTIVALMQAQSTRPVKTFTIGFQDSEYNEANHARSVASYLGTEHVELYVTAGQARAVIPSIPRIYDEPFADSSQIPTYLISEMARNYVTVALSGDGGDELFGGYNRYVWAPRMWRRAERIPHSLRMLLANAIRAVAPSAWTGGFRHLRRLLPMHMRYSNFGDKLQKAAEVLTLRSTKDIYNELISYWKASERVIVGIDQSEISGWGCKHWITSRPFEQSMMICDLLGYLPDDILVKVDRAAMANSLETRMPLLDHRVVEFALRLPVSMKIRGRRGKWPLRQILYKHVPKELVERAKTGFGVPLDSWLRGPLRGWADDLISEAALKRDGFFEPRVIRRKWDEHIRGKRNWQHHLWTVLMFQAWRNELPG